MTEKSKRWLRFRTITLLVFFLVLFIALISRAFQIQILYGGILKAQANRQYISVMQRHPERGLILDRNGEKLAASIMVDSVCANPQKIKNPVEASSKLSSVLNVKRRTILKKLSKSGNFCWIARRTSPDCADDVTALNIDGIYLTEEPKRFYPNGELAGQLLGFAGFDSTGLEGLELKYDSYLRGKLEKCIWGRDAKGKKIFLDGSSAVGTRDDTCDLILTIDGRIQYLVESQLRSAIRDTGSKGGLAVVMDPKSGEILAMANVPGFNPNIFFKYHPMAWRNKVITDCFDPGSTFKPFLVAGALEEGVIKENDRFYCEDGVYAVGGRRICDVKKHEELSIREILKYSSNIGAVKVAEVLGKEKFGQYIRDFGFGSKTGIDLPGESPGILREPRSWTKVDTAAIAFGQGVSVTAIQLITAFCAIANDGVLMKPCVVRGLIDHEGRVVKEFTPTVVRRVISSATAGKLTSFLTSVVEEEDGTGRNARIANVTVAGKSGTSQKLDTAKGKYSRDMVTVSFMGFFPAWDPHFAILVVLDEPKKKKWGGESAAPVFKKIAEQVLVRGGMSTYLTPCTGDTDNLYPVQMAGYIFKRADLATTGPSDEASMPDFRGMSMRNVLKLSQERAIDLKITGSGWAIKQNPSPGVPLKEHKTCEVFFSAGD